MRKEKSIFAALALWMFSSLSAFSQEQFSLPIDGNELQECRRLFSAGRYSALSEALPALQEYALTDAERSETEYWKAATLFEMDATGGKPLLTAYLKSYPHSPHTNRVRSLLGAACYFEGDYKGAVNYYQDTDLDALPDADRDRSGLYYAMALVKCDELQRAYLLLNVLQQTASAYQDEAIFYRACIDFYDDKTDAAYNGFKKVEMSPRFFMNVPYYMGAIRLRKGEYVPAEQQARLFISSYEGMPEADAMKQILGGALFFQERYAEAAKVFSDYASHTDNPQRTALYQWGLSLYQTNKAKQALEPLGKVVRHGEDEMTQNAYLHIGLAQLQLQDKTPAREAFGKASKMNFDKRVKEEAMYNYALCLHESGYSPFAESVKVFERFLNEFPASKYSDKVNGLLSEVYLNSHHYDVALTSIEKIGKPGPSLLSAKQRILYRLGIQEFINNRWENAIRYFNRSLELSNYNPDVKYNAYYWRGEAGYRQKNYDRAAADYGKCISPAAPTDARLGAIYGLGYVNYQQKNYNKALSLFSDLARAEGVSSRTRADACNRMGDCYFYGRQYDAAAECYERAWKTDGSVGDYAMYRCALASGIKKDYSRKRELLKSLISLYAQSVYVESAAYELGRTYVELEEKEEALDVFQSLLKKYPQSALARKAALEIASIHYQNNNTGKAIPAYKRVIEKYPNSDEAKVAEQDLKAIYFEQGKGDEYERYAANTKGVTPLKTDERDKLTYEAAENLYINGKTPEVKQGFNRYLQQFPQGASRLDAHYYLGLIYYKEGDKTGAQAHLNEVIAFPDNKYSEEAMNINSLLYFQAGDYANASILYEKIAQKTTKADKRTEAQMNLLRCAYLLEQADKTIETAALLIGNKSIRPEWEREARYDRMKAYLWKKKQKDAYPDMEKLSKDTRDDMGAEAKYLTARYLYHSKEYEKFKEEVNGYIENPPENLYWLARSMLLLSDYYMEKEKDLTRAKSCLSALESYNESDEITTMRDERLQEIKEAEAHSNKQR